MSPRPAPAGGGGVFVGGHGDTATVASVVNLGTGTTPQAVIPRISVRNTPFGTFLGVMLPHRIGPLK